MSEFLIVAQKVLAEKGEPMRPKDIVEFAFRNKLFSDNVAGKTPHQTMKAKLSVDIRRHGSSSKFIRTAPGRFFLRELIDGRRGQYDALPLMPPNEANRILVFPSKLLDTFGRFQGVTKNWKRIARSLLTPSCFYMNRLAAESDNDHKQILTYIMVRKDDRLLAYKRGTFNRVEDFLKGAQCIGFGGHVSEKDLNLFSSDDLGLIESAIRELKEELDLPASDLQRLYSGHNLRVVGVLNDDSSLVGRRHFAFILEYTVSENPLWFHPKRGEKSITQLRWLNLESPDFSLWNFEYWSQLCIREFFSRSLRTQPAFRLRRRARLRPPNVLFVLGPVGSGKSEATAILKEEFGYSEVNSGQVIADLLGIPPVPATPRIAFQEAAWAFIDGEGSAERLAQAIWSRVLSIDKDRVLIDGIRQRATIRSLQRLAGTRRIGLLYIHTPPDVAYQFFCNRQGPAASIHDFLALREAPVEREVESLIGECDAVLYNWTGQKQYRQVVRNLMQAIGTGRRKM